MENCFFKILSGCVRSAPETSPASFSNRIIEIDGKEWPSSTEDGGRYCYPLPTAANRIFLLHFHSLASRGAPLSPPIKMATTAAWWGLMLCAMQLLMIMLLLLLLWRHGRRAGSEGRVAVLVLGDLGRSPRMQYHALSLAQRGRRVSFIGYPGEYQRPRPRRPSDFMVVSAHTPRSKTSRGHAPFALLGWGKPRVLQTGHVGSSCGRSKC